jgi:fermentation-respiration switch protein FrsA (DUF1100 family)
MFDLTRSCNLARSQLPGRERQGLKRQERTCGAPIGEARALFERAPEPKQFWAVRGAGHVDLEAFAPDDYRRIVLPFLTESLQTR